MRILIILAVQRSLNWKLQSGALALAHRTIASDTAHEFGLFVDLRDTMALKEEASPWSRLCRVADKAVSAVDLTQWDRVLWVDADVVDYPEDVCSRLLSVNPKGITAPLPLIEGSTRLYDTAACIQNGADEIKPRQHGNIAGRNLRHEPPYWHDTLGQPRPQQERFVPMDCVGMVLLCPAAIFAKAGVPDHPAFTGWYGICKLARDCGLPVGIDTYTVAYHANLPVYGIPWH